jgi:hypothetical protein
VSGRDFLARTDRCWRALRETQHGEYFRFYKKINARKAQGKVDPVSQGPRDWRGAIIERREGNCSAQAKKNRLREAGASIECQKGRFSFSLAVFLSEARWPRLGHGNQQDIDATK